MWSPAQAYHAETLKSGRCPEPSECGYTRRVGQSEDAGVKREPGESGRSATSNEARRSERRLRAGPPLVQSTAKPHGQEYCEAHGQELSWSGACQLDGSRLDLSVSSS